MPLNGAGVYAAPASSWNPAINNTDINATDWIALLADFTTVLSTAFYKDGQSVITNNISMNGYKFTNTPGVPVMGATWTSTSGASNTWSGIPSWCTRITVNFSGVSLSGLDQIVIRLGDSGGLETSGYIGACNDFVPASTGAMTLYWAVTMTGGAAAVFSGSAIITLLDAATNTWSYVSTMTNSTTSVVHCGAGSKPLSATLTQVQVKSIAADTFDAGIVNIVYE